MSGEIKIITICAVAAVSAIGIIEYSNKRHKMKELEEKNATDIKIAEIQGSYPPEYWEAKKAEADANAEVEKAKIESEERLKIDERTRKAAELSNKREFEKNAPAEYWEQKRIEEEEKTKRERDRLQHESEMESAKQHRELLRDGSAILERSLRRNLGYSNGYSVI